MKQMASIEFDPLYVKTLREKLCMAQSRESSQIVRDLYDNLIAQLDQHRPLGSNGKHGDKRCTTTCGCDERQARYDA